MASRSIMDIFNDAALTAVGKADEISFAASGSTPHAAEYAKFKNDEGDKIDKLKREADALLLSSLLTEVEAVAERIMEDGLAEGESDDHARGLHDFEARAADGRAAIVGIRNDLVPVEATFRLFQQAEKTMIGMPPNSREETRLALQTIEIIKGEAAKIENKLQDVSDAVGMAWNMLGDVRDHHRRESDKAKLHEYLDNGLSTDKPLSAPAPARFRR
ncbi:MAG TPA: hypothetical protein VEF76_00845 [Patescibacteria group bacterium]|nr:hypothetical protein [Patescibacteria group bacterium]